MCGIAGCYHPIQGQGPTAALIQQMLAMIEHRGPDEFGLYLDAHCGLGHARLSIIDLATGSQPLCNEDETLWITFNGEIFNYLELRELLQKRGHQFRTQSDTEVIVHAFEEWGKECLSHFNGQFAFAIWNSNTGDLFFARDRLGICPLYYTEHEGSIAFASEIKALFCLPGIPRELDRRTLSNIFTWWTPGPGETAFRGIHSLPAGHCALVNRKGVVIERYWTMEFPEKFDTARTDD